MATDDYERGWLDATYFKRSTRSEFEDKSLFVKLISEALVACGDGRYDRFESEPLEYVKEDGREVVRWRDKEVNVTYDSLPAMLSDIVRGGLV